MITTMRVCFPDVENEVPEPGYEFYLVEIYFTNTGETRIDGYSKPQLTNVSREPRVSGWLGCTNNVDETAVGKYRVVSVLSKRPKYYCQGVKVRLEAA